MTTLEGKVAIVTGGGRGLGEAISLELAKDDVIVLPADIRMDLARKVSEQIISEGGKSEPLELDVTNEDSIHQAYEQVMKRYGCINILINNAGTDKTLSVEDISVEEWDRVLMTNLRGPFLMSKFVYPILKSQGGGQIINITSTAAKRAWANASAYHASKWGLLGFSHALHVEGRKDHIKVTAVIAGGMRTPFLLDRFPDIDVTTLQDPRNVAETIRFILAMPAETVIPEVMVIPMTETSWP